MSDHRATIIWRRTTPDFAYDTYDRSHEWRIDGGVVVPASSAPEFKGTLDRVDPERALVAALASCHMLTFLAICARKRIVVDAYEDAAVGVMTKNAAGKLWVSLVTLHPRVTFAGTPPDAATLAGLHESAHENCFIANSVKTEIRVAPV